MSWRFVLGGDAADLFILSTSFPAPGDVRVIEVDGQFVLEADALDAMTGDHVARLAAARALLPLINGWAITQDPNQKPVSLPGTGTEQDGTPFTVVLAGSAHATARAFGIATVTIDGVAQIPPTVGANVVTQAATDQALDDLLTLVGSHPHDFYTLYKIHEIIEDETNGGFTRAWTTKAESKRFTLAANNRGASGLHACHAKTRKPPAKTPMTLEESRLYVVGLAGSFLKWVADGRPSL